MVVDIFGQFEVQKGDLAGQGFRKFAGGKSVPDPEGKVIHTDGEQGTINILDDVTAQLGVVLDCMVNKKSKGEFLPIALPPSCRHSRDHQKGRAVRWTMWRTGKMQVRSVAMRNTSDSLNPHNEY